jgi:DNA-binding CsgD family transcriptional regulator/truncated hemoglobin YjbI
VRRSKTVTALVEKSLYERVGGKGVIAKIISDLYDRMLLDPHTWYYWKGHSNDSKAIERRHFTDLVCATAGGPVIFQTQELQTAFKALGISKVEWEFFIDRSAEALDQSRLSDREKEELFSLLTRGKTAITDTNQVPSPAGAFAAYPHELTQREREVLRHVALGKKNSEIAAELFISVNTVTRHLTNIFAKTSTNNRVQAAVYAARRRIV